MRYISTFTNSTFVIGVASEPGRGGKPHGLGRGEKPAGPGPGGQRNTDDYVAFEVRTTDDDVGEVAVPVIAVAAGSQTQGRDERPSQIAIEAIYTVLRSEKVLAMAPRLVEALHAANQVIYQQATLDPSLAGKGATALAAAIVHNTLYLAYVGDCRVYLLRNGTAHQLTLPAHRLPQPEPSVALPTAPWGAPTMVTAPILGSAEFIDVATAIAPLAGASQALDALSAAPVTSLRLLATDTLIFCTPGFYEVVPDQELAQIAATLPAQDAAWRLADLALAAEASASHTVLIVQPTTAQSQPAPVVQRRAPSRRVRQLRRAVLMAACFLLVALSWSSLVEQGGQLAALIGAQIPQSLFSALAQERRPTAVDAPEVADAAAALPVANAVKIEPILPTPTLAPVAMALVESAHSDAAGDNRLGAAAAKAEVPAAPDLVLGQQLGQFLATTAQTGFANLRNTIGAIGATAAAGRTATAVAVAALPTPTPTMTPTPVPPTPVPPKPTPTPRLRTATATAAPTALPAPDFSQASVTLVEPAAFDTLIDKRPFRWQANFTLPPGYAFELVFWQRNQDPLHQGRGYAGLSAKPIINAGYEHFRIREAPEGEYRWGVLLVNKEPYQRIKYLGGGAVIYVKRE